MFVSLWRYKSGPLKLIGQPFNLPNETLGWSCYIIIIIIIIIVIIIIII